MHLLDGRGYGKINMKYCAFTYFRRNANRSMMPFDNSIAHRQAEPGPLDAFGRVERFEHAFAYLFFHAEAGIGEAQPQAIFFSITANCKRSACRHRVDGVYDQIDKYFAEF